MNPHEAIEILDRYPRDFDAVPKSAKSEREFRIALSKAIEALKKADKYS